MVDAPYCTQSMGKVSHAIRPASKQLCRWIKKTKENKIMNAQDGLHTILPAYTDGHVCFLGYAYFAEKFSNKILTVKNKIISLPFCYSSSVNQYFSSPESWCHWRHTSHLFINLLLIYSVLVLFINLYLCLHSPKRHETKKKV